MKAEETTLRIRVLVIDDEPQILRLLTVVLEDDAYQVSTAKTAQEGLSIAAREHHDVFLLDIGLPDLNGLEVIKQLREWTRAPIIMLTVQDGAAEIVEALDSGADDYVTKPFNSGELLARVRASLRRYHKTQSNDPVFHYGDVKVDLARRMVELKGTPVKLTVKEYALVRLLVQHAGKVLSHQFMLREVWGPGHEQQTQYLRVYMARLRAKLETPTSPPLFITEGGVGYRMAGV